jgi:hypothetical protein
LDEATFTNESASGWQEVSFSNPVSVTAGITYIGSMHSSSGDYAVTNPFFTQAVVNTPLTALANGDDGGNGVYKYSASSTFPTDNFGSSNYWVDVASKTNVSCRNASDGSVTINATGAQYLIDIK